LNHRIGGGNFLSGTKTSEPRLSRHGSNRQEKDGAMKKFGFATIIASGLTAAVLGLAGPAQADIGHHGWIHDIQPQVTVPQVDTSVQQSH
jgi:hypothetical protein